MKITRRIAVVFGLLAMGIAAGECSSDEPVSYQIDFGYSGVEGDASQVLQGGYTIGFGGVVRPAPKNPLGIRWDVTYDWWDANTGDIPDLGVSVDDGDGNQWSLRAGLQYESAGDRARFIGGVGIGGYRLHANLTNTVIVPGWICDPYWWWYCYPGLVEGDVILASKTLTKFGYYANVGMVFPLTNSDFFIEAQYHWVNVEDYFETMPIVLGWRW